jgi:hypothetical protein
MIEVTGRGHEVVFPALDEIHRLEASWLAARDSLDRGVRALMAVLILQAEEP